MTSSRLPLLFTLLCVLSLTFAGPANPEPDMILEVFRHGARAPNSDYTKVWGKTLGELTGVGMRMHYLLGAALKDRYPTLFKTYDPAKIVLRSSNYNRTIMSAFSQLYGMYHGTGLGLTGAEADTLTIPPYADYDPTVAKDLTKDAALPGNFQVLPLHVDSMNNDKIFRSLTACKYTEEWGKENGGDEESINLFKTELANIAKIMNEKGFQVKEIQNLSWLGDTTIANKFQNLPLPGDVLPGSQDYLDLKFAFEWYLFKIYGSGKNEGALHSMNILKNLQDYIHGFLNKTSSANAVLLSGHESTLLPLLVAFGITNKDCLLANYKSQKAGEAVVPYPNCVYPEFASNMVFEVYGKTAEEAKVSFLYNNVPQSICGKTGEGSNTCTLKEFDDYIKQITKDYSYEQYDRICGIKAAEIPEFIVSTYSGINFGLGVLCGVLTVVLIFTCQMVRNLNKKQDSLLERGSEKTRRLLANL